MANWYSVAFLDESDGEGWYVLEEEVQNEKGFEIASGPYPTKEEAEQFMKRIA